MSVDVVGLNIASLQPDSTDLAIRGTVTHTGGLAVDATLGTRMREPDGSAAVSFATQFLVGGGYLWATDNISQVLEPTRMTSAGSLLDLMLPEGLVRRVIVPFAGGYRRVAIETHAGVKAAHYRAAKGATDAYAALFRFPSPMTGDLWIAVDSGALVAARIAGTSSRQDPNSGRTVDASVLLSLEMTELNSASNTVTLPTPPVADPVRPEAPPVDLKLEYQVMPLNGVAPTADELNAIGVSLRMRLDVATRPVRVEVAQDRVLVTVCSTRQPAADRKLIESHGALTVVPLPAADYGTTAKPGRASLPAVGSSIDSALAPVAPAARLGMARVHVDPTSGRRGLAFILANQATDTFRAYAAAHQHEYVAVVLDGVVLATLPVEGATAAARFIFTGDYSEAEADLLANFLYSDPIPFELRPVSDIEAPSR